jgi:hypothetical protein
MMGAMAVAQAHSHATLYLASVEKGYQRPFGVATTGSLMIDLRPGWLRHRIAPGSTASPSFGHRLYKLSSAHLPSSRAS